MQYFDQTLSLPRDFRPCRSLSGKYRAKTHPKSKRDRSIASIIATASPHLGVWEGGGSFGPPCWIWWKWTNPARFATLSCMAAVPHFGLQKRFGCALRSACGLLGTQLLTASQPMVLFPLKTIVLHIGLSINKSGRIFIFVIFGLAGYSLALVHPPHAGFQSPPRMIPSLAWATPPYQPFNILQMWSHLIWVKPGRCSYTEALNFFRPSFPSIPEDQHVL